jgi:alanine racemase
MTKSLPHSYIEISEKNLIWNINQFRKLVKKGTKISAVIKGNAYGHGQNEVAGILGPYVDYFQLNSIEELKLLRKVSTKKTLLLGFVQKAEQREAIKLGAILSFFSAEDLKNINALAGVEKIVQEVHMPIDAHLGREGFLEGDWENMFQLIKKCRNIRLTGLYAHFSNIEDTSNFTHAQKQIDTYKRAVKLAGEFGFKNIETHISATSGVLVYEKNTGENSIVRIGIGLYGMWPSIRIEKLYKNKITLKPVLRWKTKIAQIKTFGARESIGYGNTFTTPRKMKVALIPQGYADGLDRRMSGNGAVLIKGRRCKILGRVAMNMFVVDISDIKNVKEGDEAVILGRHGQEEITAEEIAKNLDTINYEITTHINPILRRVVC